jgi:hypothetical protein
MNTYQIHVDTALSTTTVTPSGQATITKVGGNPFNCQIILGNRHRAIRSVSLKNAQIPVNFYNIRAPYNTMNVSTTTYTISPGVYTLGTLATSMNTATTSVATWTVNGTTTKWVGTGSAGSISLNVQPQTLMSFLGFTDGQSGSTVTATNSYQIGFDNYISIWIENLGTSSLEPSQITYKVPIEVAQGSVMFWTEGKQNTQCVPVTDRSVRVDRLNIQVLDRFGKLIDNNGVDWSFTLEIESDN